MKRIVTLSVAFGLVCALAGGAEAQTFTKRRWKKSDPRPQMVEATTPEGALVLTLARAPFPMPQSSDQVGSAPATEPGDAVDDQARQDKPKAEPKSSATAQTKKAASKKTSSKSVKAAPRPVSSKSAGSPSKSSTKNSSKTPDASKRR